MSIKGEFGLLFYLHLILIFTVWASPLLFPWYVVAIGFVLYNIQLYLVGNCLLTILQFKTNTPTLGFYGHYSKYLGLECYAKKIDWASDYILPSALLATSLIL